MNHTYNDKNNVLATWGTSNINDPSKLSGLRVNNDCLTLGLYDKTGAAVISGTSSSATLPGTLNVVGNFSVATNKFTVTAASGNTAVAGTLAVTGAVTMSSTANVVGNFSVATNKFTVTAASGNTAIAGTLGIAGVTTLCNATATPAGGSTSAVLLFGTTAGFGIYYGSGAPTVTAAQGSIYIRSDGSSTSTRLYVNTTGSTTWTSFTSAT